MRMEATDRKASYYVLGVGGYALLQSEYVRLALFSMSICTTGGRRVALGQMTARPVN